MRHQTTPPEPQELADQFQTLSMRFAVPTNAVGGK
jgi:hypothetical protein